jgi:uncharacterized SAM-binding protein YcdF (DUF218 family)
VFVTLSKLLDVAVSPISWALLLVAIAVLARRRPVLATVAGGTAGLLLYGFSVPAVANRLMEAVEAPARDTSRPGTYDAVIVLSGMVDDLTSHASGRVELTGAADRIVAGFELLRQGRAGKILITGGPVRRLPGVRTEPELLAAALRAWGVDPSRIVIETASRNTHENAVESARVVAAQGWRSLLLVTSAWHMPRALACFRAVGLRPDTFPVDRRALHDSEGWLPRARFLAMSEDALRELAGRLVYGAMGYA